MSKSEMQQIAEKLQQADAIIIGASNGLSITEGIHLFADNQAMHDVFGDLQRKYGLQNILQGMMGRWPSPEHQWGFWSRLIAHYCGDYKPTQVMQDLKAVVGDKDYFIVTTNGENHFQMSGFDENKIYEIEGDWLHMTCSKRCHEGIYPSLDIALKMAEHEEGGLVPGDMVPQCPKCGAPMQPHMESDTTFVPNDAQAARFQAFLQKYSGKNIVILELGIGARNQLIKAPLMQLTSQEPHATYLTINLGEVYIREDIKEKSFGLDGYLSDLLSEMRQACEEYKYQKK